MVWFKMWLGYWVVHGRSSKYTAAEEKWGSIAVKGDCASPPRRPEILEEFGLSVPRFVVEVYGGGAEDWSAGEGLGTGIFASIKVIAMGGICQVMKQKQMLRVQRK